jgi:hypothetical protein
VFSSIHSAAWLYQAKRVDLQRGLTSGIVDRRRALSPRVPHPDLASRLVVDEGRDSRGSHSRRWSASPRDRNDARQASGENRRSVAWGISLWSGPQQPSLGDGCAVWRTVWLFG